MTNKNSDELKDSWPGKKVNVRSFSAAAFAKRVKRLDIGIISKCSVSKLVN